MTTNDQRRENVRQRLESTTRKPVHKLGRDYVLHDGRRVIVCYSKAHHGGSDFYLGLPNRLQPDDVLILLLADKDLVFPSADFLLRYKESYPRSANGRPIPSLQVRNGKLVLRVARLNLTVSLDDHISAYDELAFDSRNFYAEAADFGLPFHEANEEASIAPGVHISLTRI